MSGKKLFLYMGLPKAGSSTIAKFLTNNKAFCFDHDIEVFHNQNSPIVDAFFKSIMSKYLQKGKRKRKTARMWEMWDWYTNFPLNELGVIKDKVKETIEKSEHRNIVIGCIGFSGVIIDDENRQAFYDELSELSENIDEVSIILYVRNQVEYMVSFYQESVKLGETTTFDAFLNEFAPYLDWWGMYLKIKKAFPEADVTFKPLEGIARGHVLNDFAHQLGIFYDQPDGINHNVHVNHAVFPILREMNKYATPSEINVKRKVLFNVIAGIQRKEPNYFPYTERQLAQLRGLYSNCNKQLFEEIGIEDEKVLSDLYVTMSFNQKNISSEVTLTSSIQCFQEYLIMFLDQLERDKEAMANKNMSAIANAEIYGYLRSYVNFNYPADKRVALYGSGSHTKIFLRVLREKDMNTPFVIDDINKPYFIEGVAVSNAEGFDYSKIDRVIISSCSFEKKLFDKLVMQDVEEKKIVRLYT